MALTVNNNDRIVPDNLLMVFDFASHWDLTIPGVCKTWKEWFCSSKWNQLENLVNSTKIQGSEWWKETIKAVREVNSDRAPASTLIRDLNSLISEEVNSFCTQIFRRRFSTEITTTTVYEGMKEPVSRWLRGTLAVRQMADLNEDYHEFASKFLTQTYTSANPANDHLLFTSAPPITEHHQICMGIIRQIAPQMFVQQSGLFALRGIMVNSRGRITNQQRSIINIEAYRIFSEVRITIPEFQGWKKREFEAIRDGLFNEKIFPKIYQFAGNANLAAVSRSARVAVILMRNPLPPLPVVPDEAMEDEVL